MNKRKATLHGRDDTEERDGSRLGSKNKPTNRNDWASDWEDGMRREGGAGSDWPGDSEAPRPLERPGDGSVPRRTACLMLSHGEESGRDTGELRQGPVSCLTEEEDELHFAREKEDDGVEDKRKARASDLEVQTG